MNFNLVFLEKTLEREETGENYKISIKYNTLKFNERA